MGNWLLCGFGLPLDEIARCPCGLGREVSQEIDIIFYQLEEETKQ